MQKDLFGGIGFDNKEWMLFKVLEALVDLVNFGDPGYCHRPCFGVYAIVGFEPSILKNDGSLLLISQTVKLSDWSHGPSRALSHDRAHVLSPDHDSSPLMTRHLASPYLSYLSATLLIGCHTFVGLCFAQPHFWLVVLILIVSHTFL